MVHATDPVCTASMQIGAVGSPQMGLHASHSEADFYGGLGVSLNVRHHCS